MPSPELPAIHPCPRCNRQLRAGGEVSFDGLSAAVFQCDECIRPFKFPGGKKTFDTALTFAVDAQGRVLDASTLEPFKP